MLSGALRQLFALSENYPNLKANANFQQLQSDLSDIENKLAASRRFFNNAVQEYNTGIQQMPAALFAASFGFHPHAFFDLGEQRAASRTGAEREVLAMRRATFPGARRRRGAPQTQDRPVFANGSGSARTLRAAPNDGTQARPWPPTVSTRISSPTSGARSRC